MTPGCKTCGGNMPKAVMNSNMGSTHERGENRLAKPKLVTHAKPGPALSSAKPKVKGY